MADSFMKVLFDKSVTELNDILSIKELPNFGGIPQPIVPNSRTRPGVSVQRAYERVMAKKEELGLFIGVLPDGSKNKDNEIIREIITAIIDEITLYSKINSVDLPGTDVVVASPVGPLYGKTVNFSIGGASIT